MVALLEPRNTEIIETRPVVLKPEPQAGYKEWRYAVPCAGVKYYAFKPVAPVPAATREAIIAPRLIDERVILL